MDFREILGWLAIILAYLVIPLIIGAIWFDTWFFIKLIATDLLIIILLRVIGIID